MTAAASGAADMTVGGRIATLGDDISTDLIYPGRYLFERDPARQAAYALTGLGEEWPARLADCPVLVAGENFGCGSSREQAPTSLRGAGVRLIVAASFARIFFRNCINTGLPVIQSPELSRAASDGATLAANLSQGTAILTAPDGAGETFTFAPLPAELIAILGDGGLMARLAKSRRALA
ncbi:LeuD/DmdB family oxidoreductase small subunit [Rhodobium gokarnense]|uniref:3-isopropylmalate dehydratase n=1 Tax=Rhodobium gokarnense TaxID=364296 RepID=A0ABT3H910_9HYPH|nr:3-isopropylmalate dehydratase [Rhodobium gokarnense]MCW2306881.1 3-isopropylmalate/(R)-2-methylmalate dehydratase small subunit [Rhodobium gokarnense]